MTTATLPALPDDGGAFGWKPWALALVAALGAFVLFTRANSYPYYYEPDAPTKVAQVMTGERNFHHPLLMLTATDLAMSALRMDRTAQNTVIAGRGVIAAFGAIAVGALVLLAWRLGGMLAGVAAALMLGMHPYLFELAHHMKEDPALLMGVALSFLAMDFFWRTRSPLAAAMLGAANALAISGKYIGVATLLLAVPLLLFTQPRADDGSRRLAARLGAFFAGLLVVLAAVNYEFFTHVRTFQASLAEETGKLTHERLLKKIPHTKYTLGQLRQTFAPVAIFCVFFQSYELFRRRRLRIGSSPVEWMLIGFSLAYILVLNLTPKLFGRYFLPPVILGAVFAALGAVSFARWIAAHFSKTQPARAGWIQLAALGALLAGILVMEVRGVRSVFASLTADPRRELAQWIDANLPADAMIATDRRVYLLRLNSDQTAEPMKQKVITSNFLVGRLGTLDELRRKGVTHIAIHQLDTGKYLPNGKNAKPDPDADEAANTKKSDRIYRQFGKQLGTEGALVWKSKPGNSGYTNPGLKLYRIAKDEQAAAPATPPLSQP